MVCDEHDLPRRRQEHAKDQDAASSSLFSQSKSEQKHHSENKHNSGGSATFCSARTGACFSGISGHEIHEKSNPYRILMVNGRSLDDAMIDDRLPNAAT